MKNPFKNPKAKTYAEWAILVIALFAAAFCLWLIFSQLEILSFQGNIGPIRRHHLFGQMPPGLSPADPSQIRGWMTFRYLDAVFKLPADYLKSGLGVTDTHYPNISINFLAKEQKQDSVQVLDNVINLVKNYQAKPAPAKD